MSRQQQKRNKNKPKVQTKPKFEHQPIVESKPVAQQQTEVQHRVLPTYPPVYITRNKRALRFCVIIAIFVMMLSLIIGAFKILEPTGYMEILGFIILVVSIIYYYALDGLDKIHKWGLA